MVLVFDLDDTLYEEINFVKSGFHAVAEWLYLTFGTDHTKSYGFMIDELEKSGRGKIFNNLLKVNNLYNYKNIKKCLSIYRLHKPNIHLSNAACDCLSRFSGHNKYIVTDGNKIVQYNKIQALQLDQGNVFKKIFITYRFGIKNGKPSAYCFHKISSLEKVLPKEVVYIGDNPIKDFVGIKPLGFKTIRVKQGNFKDIEMDNQYEAHLTIKSLDELTMEILEKIAAI